MPTSYDHDPEDSTRHEGSSSVTIAFDSEEACWQFLDRKSPEELVEIFSTTDPLRIVERCGRFLWDEGLFMEVDRLVEQASCHIAYRCALRPEGPSLDEWLHECIDHSALELCRNDMEMLNKAQESEVQPWAPAHVFIRDAFQHDEIGALRVCSAFNSQPRRERRAFFALCMDKLSVEECLEAGFGPPEWLRETCVRSIDMIIGLKPHPELELWDDGEEGEEAP